ncbi:MAG TPA: patatin-like phospholipase family protein [Acidimicrobiales bacterium]|nr:patatin-like phospholipase family protein [Acidimicrobiales bacterium]
MPVYGLAPSAYRHGGIAAPEAPWPSRPVETAVVLGGGGNRGAVQVGMMRALVEAGIHPDLFVGTSIGAINGAAFAGLPTLEGVYLAADVWQRIAATDVFPRRRFQGAWRFLERRESVFSMDGLRRIVQSYLRFERLEEAPVPLLVIASRLDDGREEWITSGPALDAVMASAALPGFYPVVRIGDHRYVDGGVLDNVGISAALAVGARRIFVLLCGRVDAPAPPFSRPFEAMFSAFNLALGARVRRDLGRIPDDVDVVVIEQPGSMIFDPGDFSRTEELIDQGYREARDVIADYRRLKRYEGSRPVDRDGSGWLRRVPLVPKVPFARRARGYDPNAASRAEERPSGSSE